MTNDLKHLFLCIYAMHICFFGTMSFISFALLNIRLVAGFLLLNGKNFSHTILVLSNPTVP